MMFFEVYIIVYLVYIRVNICYMYYLQVSRTCIFTRCVIYQVWKQEAGLLSGQILTGGGCSWQEAGFSGQRSPMVEGGGTCR